MLFGYGNRILSETASADLLDPEVSSEVKDTVKDIEDILTNNVDEVPPEDKVDNGTDLTAESCAVFEGAIYGYKYAVDIRDIMRICEAEEEETGEAPEAADVVDDVGKENNIPTDSESGNDDLVIVAPADVAEDIIECALNEAKCGKRGKSTKKANLLKDALESLKSRGKKVVVVGKKKGGKRSKSRSRKKR